MADSTPSTCFGRPSDVDAIGVGSSPNLVISSGPGQCHAHSVAQVDPSRISWLSLYPQHPLHRTYAGTELVHVVEYLAQTSAELLEFRLLW
jgi:hypothetical protein